MDGIPVVAWTETKRRYALRQAPLTRSLSANCTPGLHREAMGISDTIRSARKRQRMSQRELGRAIGTSASAVAQWETGDTEPSVDNRVRISQALNIPIAELMPSEAVQSARAVDAQEAVLLERWRQLAPEFREAFLRILHVQIDAARRH